MRKSNVIVVLLTGLAIFSGCSSLNKMIKLADQQQVEIVPNPLELHGDSVKMEISGILPAKMLPAKYSYKLSTFYKYGESDLEVGSMTFVAEDFPNSKTTTSRKSDNYSFFYAPAMSSGIVEIQGTAIDQKGANKSTPRIERAKGIITTSLLAEDVFYAAYAASGYNDQEELMPTNVDFFFDKGKSELKTSETSSAKGKDFSAFIAAKNVTKTVTITGTHSPEGSETINSNLSEKRAQAIEKYYRSQMKKYDYKDMAAKINFILKPVVEDWTGFKTALSNYQGITDAQKSEVLKIVNGQGQFVDKEKALQKLDSYTKLLKDIYPGLRAAKTEVLTVKVKKANSEIAVLAKSLSAGDVSVVLSNEELMFAGALTPSLEEKIAIYKAAAKQAGSWEAHNNLGAAYLETAIAASGEARTKNVDMALTQLEIAINKKKTAEVQANLATAYALQGDKAKAYDAAVGALASNPGKHAKGINGVKGSIEIKKGEYSNAISSLGSADESAKVAFNKGLAQLLNKDYDNATSGFGSAIEIDAEYAKAYYAAAIAAARSAKAADVLSNLKSAVEKDPSLKEKALKDLEFRAFATQVTEALN